MVIAFVLSFPTAPARIFAIVFAFSCLKSLVTVRITLTEVSLVSAKRVLPVVGDVIETTAFSILSIFKRTCFNQSCLYILAFSFFSLSVVEKLLSKSSSIDIPMDGISFLASTNKAFE